jgi:hypothetical protein
MLSSAVVFGPIPPTNVVPAVVIALISLAYLKEDGLLLLIALLAAVIVLTVASAGGLGDGPWCELAEGSLVIRHRGCSPPL